MVSSVRSSGRTFRALKASKSLYRRITTMATPQKIQIVPQDTGLWRLKQTDEAAKKASELLQQDLEKHHVFFNDSGFHNHIVHHILSLYGTGAESRWLQKGFDNNTDYQRSVKPSHQKVVEDLQSWEHASKYLNKEQYYPDFLAFFQKEMSSKGWEAVLDEYLFSGTEAADDMLARLPAGFLHPLIQLMYGMEWKQPAIIAEGLAQTCVHGNYLKDFLLTAEKKANESYADGKTPMPSITSLHEAVRNNRKLNHLKTREEVMDGERDEILAIASRVRVRPDEVDEKTAEMFDACVYAAASASFHPPKWNKFDFFLIHHVNAAPIYLTINSQPWISNETKARLLEWKIRMDLVEYASRGAPPLLPISEIAAYQPRKPQSAPGTDPVAEIVSRLHSIEEDGHAIKLARAAAICQDLTKSYEDRDWIKIKGDDVWMRVHHLIVDSVVEAPGQNWVRSAGADEAWKEIPDRPKL